MTEAYICDAVRTPIGRYGGSLSGVRADDLAAIPIRALIERNPDVDWGELDFLVSPAGFVSTTQPTAVLFEDTYTCVVWSGNRAVGTTLTIDEYLGLGHVVVNVAGGEPPSNYDEQFLRRSNHRRRVEITVPTFSLAPQLVVGTGRVTTITTRLAAKCAATLPLRLIELPMPMPPMVEVLQWHKVHEYDPAHRWFRGLLTKAVQELPARPPAIRNSRPRRAGMTRAQGPRRGLRLA